VDNSMLMRWRRLDALEVLKAYADYLKEDSTYAARAGAQTTRWHVSAAGLDWEFLCTGPKFWDTRAGEGGGGAVDLTMHLFSVSFQRAVTLLKERGI
jgi:hypothetical protein